MKEKLKRFFASIAAIILAIGMMGANAIPAMAADTYTLTINGTEEGHTYTAYQIFAGDLATVEGRQILSNITKGADLADDYNSRSTGTLAHQLSTDAVFNNYSTIKGLADDADAATIAKAIADANLTDKSAETIELAKVFKPFIETGTGHGTASTANGTTYTIGDLSAGYYMVQDSATGDNKNFSQLILEVIQNKEITPKSEKPDLDKKITSVKEGSGEDATAVTGAVLDNTTAVAKVGSTVSFELTGSVPNTAGYSDYTYKITDKLTSGLDYVATSDDKSNVVVSIGATPLDTNSYTVDVDSTNRTLTVIIPKATLDKYQNVTNKTITVTYDAKVNNNALTYNFDKNTAQLEYSNNPESNTTSKTTEKNTYVVNINLDVEKVDKANNNTKLSGAQFRLYRNRSNNTKEYYKYDNNTGVSWTQTENDAKIFTTAATGNLDEEIKGLDGGVYYLEETKAPDGYNLLSRPIEVTITATKTTDTANQVNYTVTFRDQGTSGTGSNATMENSTITLGATPTEKLQPKGTIKVENGAGSTLPSTGGIGTTIFYVIGGVVVAGAVILLLARRRKNA